MAAKVKCPACGAKNALDARRCRICTAVINLDIPDASAADADAPVSMPEPSFDAGLIDRQVAGGRASFGGGSGLGARLAAAGNAPTAPEPIAPSPTEQPAGFAAPDPDASAREDWSPEGLWASSAQTAATEAAFDAQQSGVDGPAPSGDAPATAGGAFEPFDANALFDAPPDATDDAPAVSPPSDFEPFDADALFRDS